MNVSQLFGFSLFPKKSVLCGLENITYLIRLKFISPKGLYTFKELIEINVLFSAVGETVADAESVGTETIKT